MRAGPVIVLGFLTAALGGCATFAPLPQTPAPPAKRVSLRVSASGESFLETPPGSWRTWGPGDADLAVKALEESGWFARVGPLIDPYDYRAQIVVRAIGRRTAVGVCDRLQGRIAVEQDL